MEQQKKLIIIGGPTGVGKSAVAYNVALKIGGEIISADSMQFYREINIGTDKVPLWMREKVPHHLIDFLSLSDEFDVYQFIRIATEKIEEIFSRGNIPLIVGGSGFYLRGLLKGIFHLPEELKEKQKEVRANLEKRETDVLYRMLKKVDPKSAEILHPNDRKRISRALEVYYLTGIPMSTLQKNRKSPLPEDAEKSYYILTRNRDEMYNRIEQRVEKMFENGWIEEVKDLKEKGYAEYLKMKAPIGYKEILDYLDGKYGLDETKALIKKKTKNLARRQLTWFRKEDGVWIEIEGDGEKVIDEIISSSYKNQDV